MRTTLDLNEELISEAQKLTHIKEKTSLIHEALRALIAQSAQIELKKLIGSEKSIKSIPRRRTK